LTKGKIKSCPTVIVPGKKKSSTIEKVLLVVIVVVGVAIVNTFPGELYHIQMLIHISKQNPKTKYVPPSS
jgi:cell division protein FtsL